MKRIFEILIDYSFGALGYSSIFLLLLAIPDLLPYGYYNFSRWFISLSAICFVLISFAFKRIVWIPIFFIIALIFNPIIPLHLSKSIWIGIDLISAILYFIGMYAIAKPKDFYHKIKSNQIALYQKYFDEMLENVDIVNLTRRSLDKEFDKKKYDEDHVKINKIILKAAIEDDLTPIYLHIIFEQYVDADVLMREMSKDNWVERVLRRELTDFFPDPRAIAQQKFGFE